MCLRAWGDRQVGAQENSGMERVWDMHYVYEMSRTEYKSGFYKYLKFMLSKTILCSNK